MIIVVFYIFMTSHLSLLDDLEVMHICTNWEISIMVMILSDLVFIWSMQINCLVFLGNSCFSSQILQY